MVVEVPPVMTMAPPCAAERPSTPRDESAPAIAPVVSVVIVAEVIVAISPEAPRTSALPAAAVPLVMPSIFARSAAPMESSAASSARSMVV